MRRLCTESHCGPLAADRPHTGHAGFTLIEVLVALAVFALAATAATQTLVTAHRARSTAADLMHATQLAVERMERVRAGDRAADGAALGGFERSWSAAPSSSALDLERVDVRVAWVDHGRRALTLSCLMGRRS